MPFQEAQEAGWVTDCCDELRMQLTVDSKILTYKEETWL